MIEAYRHAKLMLSSGVLMDVTGCAPSGGAAGHEALRPLSVKPQIVMR